MKKWITLIAVAIAAIACSDSQDPAPAAPQEGGSTFSDAAGELARDVAEDAGEVADAAADRVRQESQEAADEAKEDLQE